MFNFAGVLLLYSLDLPPIRYQWQIRVYKDSLLYENVIILFCNDCYWVVCPESHSSGLLADIHRLL